MPLRGAAHTSFFRFQGARNVAAAGNALRRSRCGLCPSSTVGFSKCASDSEGFSVTSSITIVSAALPPSAPVSIVIGICTPSIVRQLR